tara:strand:+ start:39824 stop:40717 length:894 start_codon:yes stop_codon:yes gene_type:complete
MNVLIAGGSGLIGSAVATRLQSRGDSVTGVSRSPSSNDVAWADITPELMENYDAVINLAGESIAGRWTRRKKQRILESRVESTTTIASAIASSKNPPRCLIQASAAGFYGDRGDELLSESCPSGEGFLAEVCQQWEAAASPTRDAGTRLVMPRFGIVLADGPGALGRLVLVTKLLIGGPLATGRQWWSWVSLNDTIRALLFLLDHEISGPVNVATPNPETQKKFATTLGAVLRRPAVVPAPGFAIRMVLGEMGTHLLLDSTRLNPATLLEEGFEFQDSYLKEALRKILDIGSPANGN